MKFESITIRRMSLFIFDIISIFVAAYGALWIRFNGQIELYYLRLLNKHIYLVVILCIFIFIQMKFYTSLWLYASVYELRNIIIANFMATALNMIMFVLLGANMFRSWYFIFALILTALTGGVRFFYRFVRLYLQERGLFKRLIKMQAKL